jgi:hypothetical protein
MLRAVEIANANKCQILKCTAKGFGELTDITDICPPSSYENSMPEPVRNPKELLDDPRQCYAD